MSSLLLCLPPAGVFKDLAHALMARGHRATEVASIDAVWQAVLSDSFDGCLIDISLLSGDTLTRCSNLLADAGFQGKVLVLGAHEEGPTVPSQPARVHAMSELVHTEGLSIADVAAKVGAYFEQAPRSRWSGLTFDSIPGFEHIQQRYKAKLPEQLQALRLFFEARAWDDLQRRAHAIKGGAGSFGLSRLTELAAQLDRAARARDEDQARVCLKQIQQEFGGGT